MSDIPYDALRADIAALRTDVDLQIGAVRLDLVRLEAKIDSKPSLVAMFTGIVVVVFGMAGIVGTTVATLNSLGFLAR